MVTVSYPGVYIQEVPSGVRTITGVSTSIGAFFGRASKGPINQAVRLLSYADYERRFGAPFQGSDLAHSVRMFFNNGGTDCYVIRLAHNPEFASVTIANMNGIDVLVARAKAEGRWGNTVRLGVDYNTPRPYESFNLTVIQEEGGVAVNTETFTNLSMSPGSPRFAPLFVTQSSTIINLELAAGMGDYTLPGSFINDIANSIAGFSEGRRPIHIGGATGVAETRTFLQNLINNDQTSFDISVNGGTYRTVVLGPAATVPGASQGPSRGGDRSQYPGGARRCPACGGWRSGSIPENHRRQRRRGDSPHPPLRQR
jgi:hypothetical protein